MLTNGEVRSQLLSERARERSVCLWVPYKPSHVWDRPAGHAIATTVSLPARARINCTPKNRHRKRKGKSRRGLALTDAAAAGTELATHSHLHNRTTNSDVHPRRVLNITQSIVVSRMQACITLRLCGAQNYRNKTKLPKNTDPQSGAKEPGQNVVPKRRAR